MRSGQRTRNAPETRPAIDPGAARCPVCSDTDLVTIVEVESVPIHVGAQWSDPGEARRCPRGDIRLALCLGCGFATNLAFDPALMAYEGQYDNSLHFSPAFQSYASALARRLIERYDLRDKHVIEIGCGDGQFLEQLCEMGQSRGVGFDPAVTAAGATGGGERRVTFVRGRYSEQEAARPADLICCRHVLEHIEDPLGFLRMIRRTIGPRPGTILYFEVPNLARILEAESGWEIIYEHCSMFTPDSLTRTFEAAGFEVLDCRTDFGGQFIGLESRPAAASTAAPTGDRSPLRDAARSFARAWSDRLSDWRERLAELRQADKRAALWGAGARSVSFLNMLDAGDEIDCVVDLNPRKQGRFMAGTGHEIMAPEALADRRWSNWVSARS
ncbi:MAG: class I SAM-dependent methyltransferase [Planctomycetota bacterium]|jgi:SAM-dependent methyltransferase